MFLWNISPEVAQGAADSWKSGADGKWEIASNWSSNTPSLVHLGVFITNGISVTPPFSKSVAIDAATVASNAINGCLTISNLTVSGLGILQNGLSLVNAGTVTPLSIVNNFTISARGSIFISNSIVNVGLPGLQSVSDRHFTVNGSTVVASITLVDGALIATNVQTTIGDTAPAICNIDGGSFIGRNFIVGFHDGSDGTLTVNGGRFELRETSNGGATLILGGPSGGSSMTGTPVRGTMHVNGGEVILTNNFTTFVGGNTGAGALIVSNGQVRCFDLFVGGAATSNLPGVVTLAGGTTEVTAVRLSIGYNPQSRGTVWVTGGTLIVTNAFTEVLIGGGGVGELIISNGLVIARHISVATNPVAGSGNGKLTVVGGQLVITGSNSLLVGQMPGGSAVVDVRNSTIYASNSNVSVGKQGGALFNLSNAVLLARSLDVGSVPGGTGMVNLVNSSLTVSNGTIAIGNTGILSGAGGVGRLTVSNSTVTATRVLLGNVGAGSGSLDLRAGGLLKVRAATDDPGRISSNDILVDDGTIDGPTATLTVGENHPATMTISNGLTIFNKAIVGVDNYGTFNVIGGSSSILSNLIIGASNCTAFGLVWMEGGQLCVTNAAATAVLEVRNGALLQSGGTLIVDRLVITNACVNFGRSGGTLVYQSATLTASADLDLDEMNNGFEQAYGLDPFDAGDAALDNDGDGYTNLEEFLAGTSPTNSASAFRITGIVKTNNDILVIWTMGPGKTNALERTAVVSGSFVTNNFTSLFVVTNSVGPTTNFLDVGAASATSTSLYYRVRLVP